MGKRTRSRIGTNEGVKTVRVYSANPKTADGYNTFIFRRDIARSLNKLAWAPVIDGHRNPIPEGIEIGGRSVRYSTDDKRRLVEFVERMANAQKGPIENEDFGHFEITKVFATEVQCHAISTRREIESVSSAAEIARNMVHFVGSPNEELKRKKPNKYFEYGLAKIRLSDGVYLVMGEVGIRVNKRPYYDQRVVAKFKVDSEVTSLHGQTQIGESTFERIYDNRFRLILQGVEMYSNTRSSNQQIANQTIKQSPKFSIIIPCYKVEKYIRECLDSVLAQKVDSWEAICTDDGSPDGTGAILAEYAARDSRIKVIHQENAGLSAARNVALDIAQGEWLVYLDSDDLLPLGALDAYERASRTYPNADIIRGRKFNFNDGEKIVPSQTSGVMSYADLSGRVTDICTTGYFQQYAFRRDTFGDLRYYGASWCEERPYGAKCATRIRGSVDVDAYTYLYRFRQGSITQTHMTIEQFKGYLQTTKDVARIYRDSGRIVDSRVIRGLMLMWMEHQVYFLITHLRRDEKPEAWKFWFDSLRNLGQGLKIPTWFRFTRFVCMFSRSRFLAWCLCFVPEWLKLRGIHR